MRSARGSIPIAPGELYPEGDLRVLRRPLRETQMRHARPEAGCEMPCQGTRYQSGFSRKLRGKRLPAADAIIREPASGHFLEGGWRPVSQKIPDLTLLDFYQSLSQES